MRRSAGLGRESGESGIWRKPSRCQTGECVEVSQHESVVMLRDSMRPQAIISVTAASWQMFTDAIRAGEFDLPR